MVDKSMNAKLVEVSQQLCVGEVLGVQGIQVLTVEVILGYDYQHVDRGQVGSMTAVLE
jgi:hypothetical protein